MNSVYNDFLESSNLKQRIEDAKNIHEPNSDPTQHQIKMRVYEVEFLLKLIEHQQKVITILDATRG